jgi:hypothetical protein
MWTALAGVAVLAAGVWMIWIALPGPNHETAPIMQRRMLAEAWPMLSMLTGVAGIALIAVGILG